MSSVTEFAGSEVRQELLILRPEVGIPGLLLGVRHPVVFWSPVAVGFGQCHVAAFVFANLRIVRPVEMSIDFHFILCQRAAAIGVVVKQVFGFGNFDVVERAEMPQRGSKCTVRSLVLTHQKERFAGIARVPASPRALSVVRSVA